MRGTRWLLVLAILAILAGIGVTFRFQQERLQKDAPVKPALLPTELSGVRSNFTWVRKDEGRTVAEVSARKLAQEANSNQVQLEDVELKFYSKRANSYNFVKSAKAQFNESKLHSDGEVEITLNVPMEGQPAHPLVHIKSAGVTFDVKTGKADTNRPASFTFENGDGKSVGAAYDPSTRELNLRSQAELNWRPRGPHAVPMKIQAGELIYREASSTVWLNQWARLTRDNTVVDAASAVVLLKDDVIRQVDAVKAHGVDQYPKRKLEYTADELHVTYNDQGEPESVGGKNNARLVATSEGSETTMTSDMVSMDFETLDNQSVLKRVLGMGHSTVISKPLPVPGGKLSETRVLHSETIEIQMRSGGREIQMVQTHTPGKLEFIPNQPSQRRRQVEAVRMGMTYGPANQIQSFRAITVQTETDPTAEEQAKKHAQVSKTRSQNLFAEFEPKTGQMKSLEQWDDFVYEAGDRRAKANRATMDAAQNLMTLDTAARVWDPSGATSADHIRIDQKSGDFAAENHVNSSRLPDKKKPGSSSEMLSGDQPIEAVADHMTAANHNREIHYEGHVVLWQAADRITAQKVDIDREKRLLAATGNVVTQFIDKPEDSSAVRPAAGAQNAAPSFVVVKADSLVYTEQDRQARYTGNVLFTRPGLRVKSDELRAFLTESKSGDPAKEKEKDRQSRLEKAIADGHVEILQAAVDRTRTGTGEHAEYYTADERIILRGGQPQLVDSKRGYTRGAELTYSINDDRLQVSGTTGQRATSRLRRK
ncbi:MAG: LPS export ABC transporter periplasmic protein LptC [Acidobacteria bacterium]|nr:MAG: LPS export ABC transporter periplasmic protein LptC [Acidobacteriota bacterium]